MNFYDDKNLTAICMKGPAAEVAIPEPQPIHTSPFSSGIVAKSLLHFLNPMGLNPTITVVSVLTETAQTSASHPPARLRYHLLSSTQNVVSPLYLYLPRPP